MCIALELAFMMKDKSLNFFLWVSDFYLGIVKMGMSHLHEKGRTGGIKQGEQGIFIYLLFIISKSGNAKNTIKYTGKAISMDCQIATASVSMNCQIFLGCV